MSHSSPDKNDEAEAIKNILLTQARRFLPDGYAVVKHNVIPPALAKDELYVGAIISADGKGHHVILLPGDKSKNWKDAVAWAKKQGGALPDRVEQALLFRDHKKAFQEAWYWNNTTHARDGDCAWLQYFGYGYQYYGHKDYVYRCRAVRRVPI